MKKIRENSILLPYLVVPFHPKTILPLWAYFKTVVKDFFALQFLNKFHFLHIPVVHVDHKLDSAIPFVPKKVGIYLNFVNYWIRPLSMVIKKFGLKKAGPIMADWFRNIRRCYSEASRMYKFRMSTMTRPKCNSMFYFRVIHFFDPHLLCVPSLHIAVVILTFSFYRNLFESEDFSAEERHEWFNELYDDAVAIAESVMYIKQHSVNCVPAAMYMMSCLYPDWFSPIDAVEFINRLFEKSTDIDSEDKDDIIKHILFVYETFLLEGMQCNDWREPVQRWILAYN